MKKNSVFFSIALILALLSNLMFQVPPAYAAGPADKDITAFSFFASPASVGIISGNTIAVTVPFGTDVTALVANFTITGVSAAVGATPQVSGVTANNFTSPVVYTVTAADASTKDYTVTVTVALNPAKDITAYSFASPAAVGVITGNAIAVSVPAGTNVTALVASFTTTGATVKVGATVQVSGVTANNFTSPRIYTVTAADGTTKNYTVTVTVAPDLTLKDITSFNFASPVAVGVITGTNIAVHVPFGTNVTALVPTIALSGGTVSPLSGVAQDFTSPVLYTVTAADTSTKVYTVTVTVDPLSSAKAITSFSVPGQVGLATISEAAHTIAVTVPFGTNVTAIVASFSTTGASVAVGATPQVSGVTANNFTSPVVYTVTAADASTQNYTVTVTIAAPSSAKAITSFTVPGQTGLTVINEAAHTITVTVPFGTNVSALVATFSKTGVSVAVGATPQVSGVTVNNFTSPVTYTVTAQDSTTQDYVVTIAPNITKDLTSFSFSSPSAVGIISGTNIAVTVPFGTDVTALVANFTTNGTSVTVGATPQVSGVTANNFTSPVVYTVTGLDSSTKDYTVTVTVALNPAKDITAYSFASPAAVGVITGNAIAVSVPAGTNVTALVASFTTTGTSVKIGTTVQVSGVTANNFTSPRTYTVTAADGTTKNYTVTVTVAPDLTLKDITSFNFASPVAVGVITGTNIAVHVPFGTNVTALVPTIALSGGTVSPLSGVAQDFTSPVLYTVTAADTSTKVYTVTVTVDPLSSAKAITSFSVPGQVGLATISEAAHTIAVTVPFGTNVTAIVASFSTTGASVAVGATPQVSGVTANNFTSPVVYTVTAADASTQNYTVTVTIAAPSSAKAITSFTVPGQTGLTVINEAAHTITVTVPFGTNVSALVATFSKTGVSVAVGATPQVSGVTVNNFTSPVTYTVTAQDSTTQDYVVTIAPNITKDLTSFSFSSPSAVGIISGTNIAVTVPFGTDVTALVANFTTNGTSVAVSATPQVSGVTANNFTSPVVYTVTGLDSSTKDYTVTVTVALNPAKDITAYSFASPAAVGVITGNAIAVTVPAGTNVTALVASFTTTGTSVTVGATVQVSGVTANNFTSPRIYTVTAADGSTKNYTVTVTVAPSVAPKDITAFGFTSPAAVGVITGTNIAVNVPFGTDVTALVATFTTTGASVAVGATPQVSGVTANNFSSPVTYTVTGTDSATKDYVVTVTIGPSPAKDITAFGFSSPAATGVITGTDIAVTVPFGTDVTALVATFTTTGASVAVGATPQVSGVTANNFTSPVVYIVTAADSTTKSYTVTVTIAANSAKDITAFGFTSPAATGVITGTDIAVTVPFGTDVTALVATFTTTGNSVAVSATPQVSGVTANNFTSPVTYTVTAQDATTKNYVVTVTIAASSAKAITSFTIPGQVGVTEINEGTGAITVHVPFATNVTALVPTITLSGGTVSPLSGVAQNFTNPVDYTVTAADLSTKVYTVTVVIDPQTAHPTVTASGAGTVLPDSQYVYTFTYATDENVSGTQVIFTLPNHTTYVTDSGSFCGAAGNTVTCNVGAITTAGGSFTVTVAVDKLKKVDTALTLAASSYQIIAVGVPSTNGTIAVTANTLTPFADVAAGNGALDSIQAIWSAGITGGCIASPLTYCPVNSISRAQMAIFLVRAMHGVAFVPPTATGLFGDVPIGSIGADYIEQLAADGITGGCGGGNFCPTQSVTRAQMAFFLVRAKHGATFAPPTATGIFGDVPIGSFGADFIEQLAADGITSGCGGGNFCPHQGVTRAQMAIFLQKAFATTMPLPTP